MLTDTLISEYPFIPKRLYRLLENARKRGQRDNEFLEAMSDSDRDQMLANINTIFCSACKNTRKTPGELLDHIDFRENDIERGEFSSLLAVPRTINQLHRLRFQNIQPLKAPKKGKSADLVANYGDDRFAVEVCHRAFWKDAFGAARNNPLGVIELDRKRLTQIFCQKVEEGEKLKQVDATIKELTCRFGLIVLVVDSEDYFELPGVCNSNECVQNVWNCMGENPKYFYGLFPDTYAPVIFPRLPVNEKAVTK